MRVRVSVLLVVVLGTRAAAQPDAAARFEAAAFRQVAECAPATADASSGGRGGGAGVPGRLHLCGTLADLIQLAYAASSVPALPARVTAHLYDRYELIARAKPGTPAATMTGLMLRAFLVEHFGLADVHRAGGGV